MRYIMKFIFHYTRYTSVLDILDTSVRFREHFFQDSCRKSWVRCTVALEVRFSTCLVTAYRMKSQFHTERGREEVRNQLSEC